MKKRKQIECSKKQNVLNKRKYYSLIQRMLRPEYCFSSLLLDKSLDYFSKLKEISEVSKLKILQRKTLSDLHIKQLLSITRQNMKSLYDENPWGDIWANGWNDDYKFKELSHETCNYIIIYNETENEDPNCFLKTVIYKDMFQGDFATDACIISFLCFRIELEMGIDMDKTYLVGYMYELQSLEKGRGYGKFLIDLFREVCRKLKLDKIMCTVLKANANAKRFYESKCGFEIDEISPDNEPYVIMSISIK